MDEGTVNPFWFPTESKIRLWLSLISFIVSCPFLLFHALFLSIIFLANILPDAKPQLWYLLFKTASFGSILYLPIATALIWCLSTRHYKKKFHLVPADDHCPHVAAIIRSLNHSPWFNIDPPPQIWLTSDKRLGPVPFVFGMRKAKAIVVPEELMQLFGLGSKHVESVLLHELAHIKNGDVSLITFGKLLMRSTLLLIVSFWIVFSTGLILIPLSGHQLANLAGTGEVAGYYLNYHILSIPAWFLIVLSILLFRSAQRHREFYADYRIKLARPDLLPHLYEALELISKHRVVLQVVSVLKPAVAVAGLLKGRALLRHVPWIRDFWATHPSNAERKVFLQYRSDALLSVKPRTLILIAITLAVMMWTHIDMSMRAEVLFGLTFFKKFPSWLWSEEHNLLMAQVYRCILHIFVFFFCIMLTSPSLLASKVKIAFPYNMGVKPVTVSFILFILLTVLLYEEIGAVIYPIHIFVATILFGHVSLVGLWLFTKDIQMQIFLESFMIFILSLTYFCLIYGVIYYRKQPHVFRKISKLVLPPFLLLVAINYWIVFPYYQSEKLMLSCVAIASVLVASTSVLRRKTLKISYLWSGPDG